MSPEGKEKLMWLSVQLTYRHYGEVGGADFIVFLVISCIHVALDLGAEREEGPPALDTSQWQPKGTASSAVWSVVQWPDRISDGF